MPARAVVKRLEARTVEIVMASRGDADPGRQRPFGEADLVPADGTLNETDAEWRYAACPLKPIAEAKLDVQDTVS